MSRPMVRRDVPGLSLSRQCEVLSISRSSLSCKPKGESAETLALTRRLDELFLRYPFHGSRQMVRHRVRRLMRLQAVCRAPPEPASRARRRASAPCRHSSAAGGGRRRPTGRASRRPGSPSRPGPGARAGRGGPRRPGGQGETSPCRAPERRRPGSHGRSPGRALRSPSELRSGTSAGCAARRVRCRRSRMAPASRVSRRQSAASAIRSSMIPTREDPGRRLATGRATALAPLRLPASPSPPQNACGSLPVVAACRGIGVLLLAVVVNHREYPTPT